MKQFGRACVIVVTVLCAVAWGTASASASSLNLHRGSRGAQVKVVESRLYTLHLLAKSQVDRRYTVATVRAVKRFQRQQHLRVTGKVNLRTWNLVYAEVRRRTAPKPRPVPPPPAPVILGHRGARVPGITENTLRSMEYASDKADVLEFDLQLTADDEFVLMHDTTLDRTTSCTGPVVAQTLEYLRANCPTDNDGGPIPTFAEVAAYAAGKHLLIAPELKDNSVTDDEIAKFMAVIHDNNLSSSTYVQSFYPAVFPRLRGLDSEIRFVYLVMDPATPPSTITGAGATIVGPSLARLTATQVAGFKAARLHVWAFTASTSAQLKSVWDLRVDGVFTDIPGAARAMYHPS
ncbi:MAG: glycerophosphoryl diester phosphodiesterase [Marmoricola sp.]|nr:glycerophosphoryl diester phosphodiesterase [Marmoricola sp.]